jgi:beta-glucosidase
MSAQNSTITQSDWEAARQKAVEIVSKMTLKEKVYEMSGHGIARFGMSMVFSKKMKQIHAGGNKRLGIPSTIFNDGPRGLFHYKGATAFPVTMARGSSWDIDLERRVGEAMAEEIRAVGGNYSGAVCMNLLRHPAWGRAQETYGEDPFHVGEMAGALVAGIQKHHVQACVKHFAANSMENNRFGGSMNMSLRTLQEVYLPHFKKAIQRGAVSVMSAYNKLNGEYCGQNKLLLTDILRQQWGFKGYVTSDWSYGLFDAQKGIEAGMNVEMPTGKVYKLSTIKKLLREEKIKQQQIDDLILPVVATKLLFAARKDEKTYPKTLVGCNAHVELAKEVAEKSAVLLKNENAFLPLNKYKVKRIAVIGSLADVKQTGDRGSSSVNPAYIVSALAGIRNYFSGTSTEILTPPDSDIEAIKNISQNADAVIVVAGTTYLDEGEYIGNFTIRDRNNPDKKNFVVKAGILGLGGDRKYLHLHPQDIEAIHAAASVNPKIAVCLVAGSAITVEEWHNEVPAILQTFYNGMEGGNALARILFGEVNPSGKLPFTVPKLESDLPPFDSYAEQAEYGYYHGYTLFDKEKKQPRYPFGFGLSYTSFTISNLQPANDVYTEGQTISFTVDVTNTGQRAGAEVLQAYVSFNHSNIERHTKLLKAFAKVYLQKGESKTVQLAIPVNELKYYNENTQQWELEKGIYTIMVGNASNNLSLQLDTKII